MGKNKTDIMKNLILFLIIILAASSCITENKCTRKYPPTTIVKDSIVYKEKIIIRDSIIQITLPQDTAYINKYIYLDKNNYAQLDTVIVVNGLVGAMAFINDSKLGVIAYVADSTLYYQLDSARIEILRYKQEYHKESKVIVNKENTKFASFTIWWFVISLALIVLYTLYRFARIYIRL